MKKVLLATTCAAALSVFAWATDASYAQQNTGGGATQNMGGASEQQKEHKPAPRAEETRPGAMNGATNENREQAPRTNAAEQRENTQPGKGEGAMERRTPTAAEGKQPAENGKMQSGQANQNANEREKTQTGAANKPETTRSGEANERERERTHTGAAKADENKTGAANANETNGTKSGAAAERSRTGENAQQQRSNEGRAAAESKGAAGANGTAGRNEMGQQRLDPKQAAEFRSRLEKHGDIARASVDFDARVGVAVPEAVRLEPIPTDIIAEYPEFRGYDVTIVHDEVVIVDPHTREVVEVVREGGAHAAEAGPSRRERLHLSREQDEVIRRNVRIEHPSDVEFDERIDERVPDSVALIPMPGPIVSDIPEVRSYDYFVDRSDHVVIVDPETHEVVGIVEQ